MKSFAKKSLVAAASIIGAGAMVHAAPLVSIGESVDIFFNGSTNAQWRSNLFYTDGVDNLQQASMLNSLGVPIATPAGVFPAGGVPAISRPKVDSWVFYVSPGVEINIGRNSNANISIYFREDFLFYTKYSSELNTALANLYVDGEYDWGNLDTSAGFSFVQQQQNTPQTNGFNFVANLVQTDNYNAYLDADYDISPKAWVSAGFDWNRTDYTNNEDFFNRYADTDIYSAPLSFFWRVTPKLSVGPSFRFRYTDPSSRGGYVPPAGVPTATARSADYYDYFFNLAVTGEVLPKLSVGLNAGYQFRDPGRDSTFTPFLGATTSTAQDERHQFSFLADAEYEITPKLMSYANIYHDFGVGAEGQTLVNLGGDIGMMYQFNNYLSSNVEFGMENSDYKDATGREDLTTTASVSVTYSPDLYWQFSLGYYYINNNSSGNNYAISPGVVPFGPVFSDNTGASFQAHTVNMQATFRY